MEKEVDIFLEELNNKKNISSNTESSYRRDLRSLLAYLENLGIRDLNEVTLDNLNSYILMLETMGKKASTISRCVASMHSFFDFLYHRKFIDSDPSYEVKAPRVEKKDPVYVEIEEMKRLLEMPDLLTPKGLRDRAMLELMCSTGLRVSETIALTLGNLNLENGYVEYKTSDSIKVLFLGREAMKALSEYLKSGRNELIRDCDIDILFPNCYCGTMSRQGFWKVIKEYAVMAGIDKEITPHTLRNYYLNQNKVRHLSNNI